MARRDDYDDDLPTQLGPLDKMFRDTNIVLLIIFAVCCNPISLVLALVGFLTAKDPKAKSNSMTVLAISGVLFAVGIIMQVLGLARFGQ